MTFTEKAAAADAAFMRKHETNPDSLTLKFWEGHPTVEAADALSGSGRVLDVGGQFGYVGFLLNWHDYGVVDLSNEAFGHAEVLGLDFCGYLADIEDRATLPIVTLNGRYDAAFLGQILEHLDDPDAALRNVRRLCKPYAPCVVVVPQGTCHDDPDHKRVFDIANLHAILSEHGADLDVYEHVSRKQLMATFQLRPVPGEGWL